MSEQKSFYYLILIIINLGFVLPLSALDSLDQRFKYHLKINNKSSLNINKINHKAIAQTIQNCPREFTAWEIIKSFETENYSFVICKSDSERELETSQETLYLVGHEKKQHEHFISAQIIFRNEDLIIAQDEYGFTFEINKNELKITKNDQLIAQESIFNPENKDNSEQTTSTISKELEQQNNNESQLIGVVWQLEEIRYNNDQLITVDNPANYTIEFLPNNQVKIKADCKQPMGTYTQNGRSISIKIDPTIQVICSKESISDKYLKELQSVNVFFFHDGNLYFDFKADRGTMKFIANSSSLETPPSEDFQNILGFGGPSSVRNELKEDAVTREKQSLLPGVDNALQPWFNWKEQVNQDIGLNFGLDYNTVYQRFNSSLNFKEAAGGIFRFFADWTLVGRNTSYPGSLVFKVENRHDYSKIAPQNLGFQAGYSGITSTQFSDFDWGVTNLFWKQKFNKGRVSFLIGKVDPTDYVNVYALINPLTHFQNLAFLADPSIAAPNQGLGMALGAMLSDNVYLVTGFSDANGDATEAGFDTFFDDAEYFKHIEIGWTSAQDRIYFDNIHLTAWHSDAREQVNAPESWGLAFSATWFIDDMWLPFFRAGYSNGGASLMKGSVSTGVGRYFAESGNVLGLGVNWGQPADSSLDSQMTIELFYRIQLTQNWAITPDIQVLVNPALNPEQDALAVFAIRSRINF